MEKPVAPPSGQEIAPFSNAFFALIPTERTKAMRTFIPWQIWRFLVINLRMLRIISISHE